MAQTRGSNVKHVQHWESWDIIQIFKLIQARYMPFGYEYPGQNTQQRAQVIEFPVRNQVGTSSTLHLQRLESCPEMFQNEIVQSHLTFGFQGLNQLNLALGLPGFRASRDNDNR